MAGARTFERWLPPFAIPLNLNLPMVGGKFMADGYQPTPGVSRASKDKSVLAATTGVVVSIGQLYLLWKMEMQSRSA